MVTAMPFAGHAQPIRAVAAELVRRGHDVRVYTGGSYTDMFEQVGARGIPWRDAPGFDERNLAATFPRMRGKKGFRQLLINLQDLFLARRQRSARTRLPPDRQTFVTMWFSPQLVVVGLGHRTDPLPDRLPANARVAPMLPYAQLLPHISVMITNGGYGGVLQGLRYDIPLIIAGGDLDKPEVAARIGWHGAGINLRTGKPSPAPITAAYREITINPGYRTAAALLGVELHSLGGTRAAEDLLEGHLP